MRGRKGIIVASCAVVIILLLMRRHDGKRVPPGSFTKAPRSPSAISSRADSASSRVHRFRRIPHPTAARSPEQIIQDKLAAYAKSRRRLAEKLAARNGVSMTPEIDAFFAAVESGDWARIESIFNKINGGEGNTTGFAKGRSPEVNKVWPAIIDAYGVAEQAHLLPAQTLLDYGHSILDSLRPGMVYVGGTDSSRWVPALLNDTEPGDNHIVITQNGLADTTYLDYINLQFSDRMQTLTDQESHALYDVFAEDARRRYEHDQNFPDEPKQLRRAEEVKIVDGKVEITGRDAVMDMNERLLNKLMEKNPDLSFAIGESIPLPGTYADAVPLGPLMELRANAPENFTPDRAAESVEYWRDTAEFVLSNPESSNSESALADYSHDAVASARLLAAHGFDSEAEEAFRLSQKLFPGSPEAAASLAQLYQRTGRADEGQHLLQNFVRQFPSEQKTLKDFWGIELKGSN